MTDFLFKDRDGQTPLAPELRRGLRPKHIHTMGELDEYEELNIAEGLVWLNKQTDPGTSYEFWLKLHKRLFGDVWGWAGKIRTHELKNPDFHPPHQIWPALRQLEGDLVFWLKEKSYSEEQTAANFHERIETIHPFANGNGRFGRILIEHFCRMNNWTVPTWGNSQKETPAERRKSYISALESARLTRDYAQLAAFMYS